jgi:hypothetical protein
MCLLLEGKTRRWFLVAGTLFGVLFAAYLVLYWDTYGRIGMIAQQFKSIVGASDPDMAGVDYLSNLYRDYETYNLAVTIQNSPVLGLGFGHAYEAPLGWYNLLEYFRILKYIPHNSILWVASKAGAIGVFLLLLLFNLFVCRTALTLKHIRDPWTKAVLAMAILSIVNQMIVVYVEMQLSYYRNMIYLAALIGISAVLTRHAGLDENGGVSPVRKETEDR